MLDKKTKKTQLIPQGVNPPPKFCFPPSFQIEPRRRPEGLHQVFDRAALGGGRKVVCSSSIWYCASRRDPLCKRATPHWEERRTKFSQIIPSSRHLSTQSHSILRHDHIRWTFVLLFFISPPPPICFFSLPLIIHGVVDLLTTFLEKQSRRRQQEERRGLLLGIYQYVCSTHNTDTEKKKKKANSKEEQEMDRAEMPLPSSFLLVCVYVCVCVCLLYVLLFYFLRSGLFICAIIPLLLFMDTHLSTYVCVCVCVCVFVCVYRFHSRSSLGKSS